MSCNNSPRSRHSSTEEPEENETRQNTEWMSKIEMSTYDGPARRLWMGPQFKFSSINSTDQYYSKQSALLQSEEEIKQSAPLPILTSKVF
jgi:hypothetical protein